MSKEVASLVEQIKLARLRGRERFDGPDGEWMSLEECEALEIAKIFSKRQPQ